MNKKKGATAGMRLLEAANEADSKKILKEIESNFDRYTESQKRFSKKAVEIISGDKEGLYCWISTNYLMKYIPPRDRPINGTVGILDMGGASSQIAFQTNCESVEDCRKEKASTNLIANETTRLFGIDYDIYTYSNLCFGNDAARRRYQYIIIFSSGSRREVEDPCTHPRQLDRIITKVQLLEDVCTNNEKTKKELRFDSYTFKAKPDINKCKEFTRLLIDQDFVKTHFGDKISFKVSDTQCALYTHSICDIFNA